MVLKLGIGGLLLEEMLLSGITIYSCDFTEDVPLSSSYLPIILLYLFLRSISYFIYSILILKYKLDKYCMMEEQLIQNFLNCTCTSLK